jgi:hypothetical protein
MAEPAHQHDSKDAPAPPAKGDSLRDKVATAVFGFLLTGVVGTMVATWFQQRGWAWQSRVAQVEKDTTSALDSLHSASDLLDKRWSATFQMVHSIETNKQGDEAKAAKDAFASVNKDWELQYADTDASVAFNVDRPFGIEQKRLPDALWTFQCAAFPFDGQGGIDPNSAHVILTVINHCQDLVKSDIEKLGESATDVTARKALLDSSYFRLSNIYYIDDALRCVILERAVAMRRSLDTELSLGSFFQLGPQNYGLPARESECLAPYKEWSDKNKPKQG